MTTDPPKASKSGRWQFTLRTLLIGVVFVAVGCAALVNANFVVAALVATITVVLLLGSAVGAFVCTDYRKAFFVGFAIFGLGYFFFVFLFGGLQGGGSYIPNILLNKIFEAVVTEPPRRDRGFILRLFICG